MTLDRILVQEQDQQGNLVPGAGAYVEQIPEPASLSLVTAGALLLAAVRVRPRRS